jgi:hypothetical protein
MANGPSIDASHPTASLLPISEALSRLRSRVESILRIGESTIENKFQIRGSHGIYPGLLTSPKIANDFSHGSADISRYWTLMTSNRLYPIVSVRSLQPFLQWFLFHILLGLPAPSAPESHTPWGVRNFEFLNR